MIQNRHLAQTIGSAGWGKLNRQLIYKGKWCGCHIEYVPMFFPSTKLCHTCHVKNPNLTLAGREWQCPQCGAIHDRDINAALDRVSSGDYGTCIECEEAIDWARLRVMPEAATCAACAVVLAR